MNLLNTVFAAEGNATPRDVVCAKVAEEVSFEELRAMLAIAEKKDSQKQAVRIVHGCLPQGDEGRAQGCVSQGISKVRDFFKHCLTLYKQHGQRCAINKIFMILQSRRTRWRRCSSPRSTPSMPRNRT